MKSRSLLPATVALGGCVLIHQVFGTTGNDNPLGPAGEYNGSITTAGSYDPYTGNGKRFVDDLVVNGSLARIRSNGRGY
jgi:hypothetical protein